MHTTFYFEYSFNSEYLALYMVPTFVYFSINNMVLYPCLIGTKHVQLGARLSISGTKFDCILV